MAIWDVFKRKTYNNPIISATNQVLGINTINDVYKAFLSNAWVYRCIRTRAEAVADLTWDVVIETDKGDIEAPKFKGKFENILYLSPHQFLEKIVSSLDIWGVAYIRKGTTELELFDTDRTWLTVDTEGNAKVFYQRINKIETYDIQDIAVITAFSPFVRLFNLSPTQIILPDIQVLANQVEVLNRIFENGAFVPLIISTDAKLTAEQIEAIKQQLYTNYGGVSNAGKTILFSGGKYEFKEVVLKPADFGMIDVEQITKDRILAVYGVPSIFLNEMKDVNRATAEVQKDIFMRWTIKPLANNIAEQLTRYVLDNQAVFKFYFNESISIEEKQIQASIDEVYLRNGITYINEIREREGLEPLPWGNSFWGSLNLVPLASVKSQNEPIIEGLSKLEQKIERLSQNIERLKVKQKEEWADIAWKSFITSAEPRMKRLEKEILKLFRKQEQDILDKLEKYKSVNGEVIKALTIDDLFNTIYTDKEWIEQTVKTMRPYLYAFMQEAGNEILASYLFGLNFNLDMPGIKDWIEEELKRTALEMTNTTRKHLFDTLYEGFSQGESIPQLADRVGTLFEETYKHRGETIARTEVISATNFARINAGKQAGMKTKTWITAIDERTRTFAHKDEFDHALMHLKTIPIDEKFQVPKAGGGYEEIDMPGDPKASAGNRINCRCTVAFAKFEEEWGGE